MSGEINTANVAAAKPSYSGGVSWAPSGTALPTDATTPLAAAFVPLGYLSSDGLRPNRDTSTEKPKAWGGDILASLLTDESLQFEFTLVEVFRQAVNNFVYGQANVTFVAATTAAGSTTAIKDQGGKPLPSVLAFDMKHNAKKQRFIVALADSTVTAEEAFVDGGLQSYTVQVECLKDITGTRCYRYMANDDKLAS